jgi:hypothetical protein
MPIAVVQAIACEGAGSYSSKRGRHGDSAALLLLAICLAAREQEQGTRTHDQGDAYRRLFF